MIPKSKLFSENVDYSDVPNKDKPYFECFYFALIYSMTTFCLASLVLYAFSRLFSCVP